MQYTAPWWLPTGHLQTICPALWGRKPAGVVEYQRARWTTPDNDFIDVDWLRVTTPKTPADKAARPLLVLFHGLEGSSQSHYARAYAAFAQQQGWDYAVAHFRGCSGEINLAPRAYHSGDYVEMDWILRRFRSEHAGPIAAVGVSLGGNALLRWLQESGKSASQTVVAALSICSPVDLAASGYALERGFSRWVYTPMFLQTMKPKALLKWNQHPGLFDKLAMLKARTLYEFDNVFTAPLHGFRDTGDYWARASAKPHLRAIATPTLIVHARNDPFVPATSLPSQQDASGAVTLWQPELGGHVGFPTGNTKGSVCALPDITGHWLQQHLLS